MRDDATFGTTSRLHDVLILKNHGRSSNSCWLPRRVRTWSCSRGAPWTPIAYAPSACSDGRYGATNRAKTRHTMALKPVTIALSAGDAGRWFRSRGEALQGCGALPRAVLRPGGSGRRVDVLRVEMAAPTLCPERGCHRRGVVANDSSQNLVTAYSSPICAPMSEGELDDCPSCALSRDGGCC